MKPCAHCEGTGAAVGWGPCEPCRGTGWGTIFVSPSQINEFDEERGGCERKWYYRVILREPREETAAAKLGTDTHAELERHFRGSPLAIGTLPGELAASALGLLPSAHEGLLIEERLLLPRDGGTFCYYGLADLIDLSTQTIYDYKTSKNPRAYGLTVETLPFDTQSVIYSAAGQARWQWQTANLQWTYIPTVSGKGKPYPVKGALSRQDVAQRLPLFDAIARRIVKARGIPHVEETKPNGAACGKYGGCPYADGRCTYASRNPLSIFLSTGESQNKQSKEKATMTTIDPAILESLRNQIAGQQTAPAVVAAPTVVAPAPPANDLAAQIAALQAQQAAQAAAAAAPPPPVVPAAPAAQLDLSAAIAALQAQTAAAQTVAPTAAPTALPEAATLPIAPAGATAILQPATLPAEPSSGGGYTLYINCMPLYVDEEWDNADKIIQSAASAAALANNVHHYRLIDHGKYIPALAHQLEKTLKGWTRAIVVMRGRECDDAIHTLRANAARIVVAI
jgi:hypothetical protein